MHHAEVPAYVSRTHVARQTVVAECEWAVVDAHARWTHMAVERFTRISECTLGGIYCPVGGIWRTFGGIFCPVGGIWCTLGDRRGEWGG